VFASDDKVDIAKILVVMRFCRFDQIRNAKKGSEYFASWGKDYL